MHSPHLRAFLLAAVLSSSPTVAQHLPPDDKDKDPISATRIAEAARVSASDKKKNTEQMLAELRDALRMASDLESRVRMQGDMVKLNCVHEKVMLEKGLVELAESAAVRMYQAMAKGIAKQLNGEYTMIMVAHQRGQIHLSDAEACKGKVDVVDDINTENPPLSPPEDDDPTDAPAYPPGPMVPPVASPY
ncbi:MAG: hypothetical protein HY791_09170 [Deltaproteobacteria bacterium]|nr:hypothetical protein [Deltaproteobacteria bacterium]